MKYIQIIVQASTYTSTSIHTSTYAHTDYGIIPIILAFIASTIWPLSWIYSNQHNVTIAQSTLFRGIINIIFNYYLCRYTNSPIIFKQSYNFLKIVVRSIAFSMASLFIGLAQYIIPLPIVYTLVSSIILFIVIFDYLVNNIKITQKQLVGLTIGIIGIILTSNGRLISQMINQNYRESSKFQYYYELSTYQITIFTILFMIILGIGSHAFVITKNMQYNVFQVNFFVGIVYVMMGAIVYQFNPPEVTHKNTLLFYKAVLFTGLPLLLGQTLFVIAYIMSKQSDIISMMSLNSIIIAYAVSFFRYGQTFNMFVNVGIILLGIGMFHTILNLQKLQKYQQIQLQSISEDNEDGAFKKGIHRDMHKNASPIPTNPQLQKLNTYGVENKHQHLDQPIIKPSQIIQQVSFNIKNQIKSSNNSQALQKHIDEIEKNQFIAQKQISED